MLFFHGVNHIIFPNHDITPRKLPTIVHWAQRSCEFSDTEFYLANHELRRVKVMN